MTPEDIEKAKQNFDEEPVIGAAKRCGVQWTPWMGDWFTSWSPRNSNSHAEGTWDHWVDLAIKILRDPMTQIVRPEAHAAGHLLPVFNFYDESNRPLSDEDLVQRFTSPPPVCRQCGDQPPAGFTCNACKASEPPADTEGAEK